MNMMFIALLMRAWTVQMVALGATPRVLADDLMVTMFSNSHIWQFANAVNATLNHVNDMGGRNASSKSKLFSSALDYCQ